MKVAVGDWFARERVDEMIWRLWEPFVDRFARCNIWFVRGRDRALLVDTGLGVASLHEAARDLFEQPTLALATHYHFDHTGSLHEFTDRVTFVRGFAEAMPFPAASFDAVIAVNSIDHVDDFARAARESPGCPRWR